MQMKKQLGQAMLAVLITFNLKWIVRGSARRRGNMNKLKVYGGSAIIGRKYERVIIAATSKKEVAKIVGTTLYTIRTYWSVTGNESEIDAATSNPGVVMYLHHQGKYIRPILKEDK